MSSSRVCKREREHEHEVQLAAVTIVRYIDTITMFTVIYGGGPFFVCPLRVNWLILQIGSIKMRSDGRRSRRDCARAQLAVWHLQKLSLY